jgi:phenylpropionate dioxygenase-like ring-hydroxylating dioxygenase large terminal subunit
MQKLSIIALLGWVNFSFQFSTEFFRNWQCVGISENIDFSIPYKTNIGELPLVLWKNPNDNKILSCINICKHMGSKLDNGVITDRGCLKCQYHGLEMSSEDTFGEVKEHQGKLFWSYNPIEENPFSTPFYNNKNYEKSFLEVDMECSLTDSAYNTMDLRHPEYVHNTIVGFGNTIPPENVKYYKYYTDVNCVGMSFDYSSNEMMRTINNNVKKTSNFHMFVYPSFSWSKVTFDKKNLIIGVNLLPLGKKKTRWYITLCHNYYTSSAGKEFMKMLAGVILRQDYHQMKNQYTDNDLKKEILFTKIFKDEEPILELKRMFETYKYPDIDACVELYKSQNKNLNGLSKK